MPRLKHFYPYNGEPLTWCRYGCGRQIYFVPTGKGASMPVDFETKETHFANCPKLKEARKHQHPKKSERRIIT